MASDFHTIGYVFVRVGSEHTHDRLFAASLVLGQFCSNGPGYSSYVIITPFHASSLTLSCMSLNAYVQRFTLPDLLTDER